MEEAGPRDRKRVSMQFATLIRLVSFLWSLHTSRKDKIVVQMVLLTWYKPPDDADTCKYACMSGIVKFLVTINNSTICHDFHDQT